jgi:hypothetical protein
VKLLLAGLTAGSIVLAPNAGAVPIVGGNGLCPDAVSLAHWAQDNFPNLTAIGGVRADRLPDHPSGHAVDLMIPNIAYGDQVYAALQANWGRFNIRYILFKVPNHWNHIHVTVD